MHRFAAGDGIRTAFPFELTSVLQVQIFASADCDSLCAASILVHVLKREHILYGPRVPPAAALFRLCFFLLVCCRYAMMPVTCDDDLQEKAARY